MYIFLCIYYDKIEKTITDCKLDEIVTNIKMYFLILHSPIFLIK